MALKLQKLPPLNINEGSDSCGIIPIGRSGVGKSFLANRLLKNDFFHSKIACGSVTKKTTFVEHEFENHVYNIYDLPALLDIQKEVTERNRKEIQRAFKLSTNSIVLFIIGDKSGRLSEEDVSIITMINDAYNIPKQSMLLIANSVAKDTNQTHKNTIIAEIVKKTLVIKEQIHFVEICQNNGDREQLHEQLWNAVRSCKPSCITMKKAIELPWEKVQVLQNTTEQLQRQIDSKQVSVSILLL